MTWLFSNGIVALQLLMILSTLVGVLVLVQWKWTMKRMYEGMERTYEAMAEERAVAIEALERRAEALASETARIAAAHAQELTKELGRLFDAVGHTQTEIKSAIEKTGKIVEQELQKPDTSETTRETIEAIKVSTDKIDAKEAPPAVAAVAEERRRSYRHNDTARTECYQRLRDVMKDGVERYYRANPGRYQDDRSKDAMRISVHGLERMLAILSEYPIGEQYARANDRSDVERTG